MYSAFLALKAIVFRSNLQPRFTVETMFLVAKKTNGTTFFNKNIAFSCVKKHLEQ